MSHITNVEDAIRYVETKGERLGKLSEEFRNCKEIVLAAVKCNCNALRYAHVEFRKDYEIVLAAVTLDGFVLGLAHVTLKKDRNIVLAAVTQEGYALIFAHETLKKDRKMCSIAIKNTNDKRVLHTLFIYIQKSLMDYKNRG